MIEPPWALSHEVEKASALLDVVNDDELDVLLHDVIDDSCHLAGRALAAGRRRHLHAILKRAAERTVPTLSLFVERGGRGAALVSPVETAARVYGLELEGLSAEDRDFEIARQFIRFAGAAIARAIGSPARRPDPAAVDGAVAEAARAHAPGLLGPLAGGSPIRTAAWARPADAAVPLAPVPPRCGCGGAEQHVNTTTKGVPHV
jgi:hypothetical protein